MFTSSRKGSFSRSEVKFSLPDLRRIEIERPAHPNPIQKHVINTQPRPSRHVHQQPQGLLFQIGSEILVARSPPNRNRTARPPESHPETRHKYPATAQSPCSPAAARAPFPDRK